MTELAQNLTAYIQAVFKGFSQVRMIRLSHLRKVFSLMGRREKNVFISLFFISIAMLTTALWQGYLKITIPTPAYGGEYIEGMIGQPRFINPILATNNTDSSLVGIIFSGLYKYNEKGELTPDMATEMPAVSEDQKSYTVKIKSGAKWHDDRPVNAEDILFTIKAIKDPLARSPFRTEWQNTTVEKMDDMTVKFTNKDISGPFMHNLTLPIMPKHIWQSIDPEKYSLASANIEAIGSGPYALKEVKKLPNGSVQSLTLESYSNYYLGKPLIDTVIFQFYSDQTEIINALHSGEIQGYGYNSSADNINIDTSRGDLETYQIPMPQYHALFLNTKQSPLDEVLVRKALRSATNKTELLNSVFAGKGVLTDSPLAGLLLNNNSTADYYNTIEAAKFLDLAGWKVDPTNNLRVKKGKILELTIATNDNTLNNQIAGVLSKQWSFINIKVNTVNKPTKELSEEIIKPRKFDVLIFSQRVGAEPDPFVFWHSSQARDPGLNLTQFSNQEADRLIAESRVTTDNRAKVEKYARFDSIVREEVPAIFLVQNVFVYNFSSEVKNIKLEKLNEPALRFGDITNWYMSEKRVFKWLH